ncbi:MAG: (2Fe-2S)-binding protein [Odoribacter splanchnicus]
MSEIICHCFEVSREEIENAIREKGLKTVEEVGEATNAGTGCGGCQEQTGDSGRNQWEIISLPAITKRSRMKIHYPGSFCYCVAE